MFLSVFVALLASASPAAPLPDTVGFRLHDASVGCEVHLADRPTYRCGASGWVPVQRSTASLDDALTAFHLHRALRADPEPVGPLPTLRLTWGDHAVALTHSSPELLAVVAAARELVAVDDPTPTVDCPVVVHAARTAMPRGASPWDLQRRDLLVCASGAWHGFEDGHPVARGQLAADDLADWLALAEPLRDVAAPDPWANVLCPTVVRTHQDGLWIEGRPMPVNPCGDALPEQTAFDARRRQLVPFPRPSPWS